MQKEIRRKIQLYGIIAVLSALALAALCYNFGAVPLLPSATALQRFSSYTELKNFLSTHSQTQGVFPFYGALDTFAIGERGMAPVPAPKESSNYGSSYSTTNIQVAGVDEADIVKTDGTYIYSVANGIVFIMRADPPENASLLSKITFNETYLAGVFISTDSNKLAVLGSKYNFDYLVRKDTYPSAVPEFYFTEGVTTFVKVYDISNKSNPVLARDFAMSGSYFNSRMIGEYVYVVISQPAYVINETVVLPKMYNGDRSAFMSASQIYYSNVSDNYFTYTTLIALNILEDAQDPTETTVMMGATSNMYVSLSNIYVTFPTSDGQTSIYRMRIEKDALNIEAEGKVPGYVLNQFSMDEYNGYFRIATTSHKETTQNSIYVLNMNLTSVGELKLDNSEVRETIYSARFIGDKGYIVTFEQKDPFFVVDLSNPTAPKVAGKLEIPGYSSYLHLYDENHVIGLGMESNALKLSLFDVTNVNEPTEIAKYTVDGDWTYSQALYDPKAFLFDLQKQLLVLPVSITQYGVIDANGTEPSVRGGFWQGAYVFKLTLTSGFTLRGGITHQENIISTPYPVDYNQTVNRALYIGNTLYTVSNAKVKLNNLENLAFITEIELS